MSKIESEYAAIATSEKDTEFLLLTLQEYVFRLKQQRERLERLEVRAILLMSGIISGLAAGGIASPYLSAKASLIDTPLKFAALIILALSLITMVVVVVISSVHSEKAVKFEIKRNILIVEKLLMRASQIRDRGTISFSDSILIDVRLADAEAVVKGNSGIVTMLSKAIIGSKF